MARISIVTPSFNQAPYLRQTILGVAQSEVDVEHIVLDGGSTDGSVSILQEFSDQLAYWVSEPDRGQFDAVHRGLLRSTADVMAYLNSDDLYFSWTLKTVLSIFDRFPQIEWLTTRHPAIVDGDGRMIKLNTAFGFERTSFLAGLNLPGAGWDADNFIQQESTFWRRSLWERAGSYLCTDYRAAGDFELWARFFQHAQLYAVDVPLGAFRKHAQQKTSQAWETYIGEAKACLLAHAGALPEPDGMLDRVLSRRDPACKRTLIESGKAEWAPVVTYDWEGQVWTLGEN